MRLASLGWNSRFEQAFELHRARGLAPGRVVRADRDRYLVAGEAGTVAATVAGRFRHQARGPADFPVVGDWVALAPRAGEEGATIHALLPRGGHFSRRAAGDRGDEQVLAANVDVAFLVCGLDGDFNPRRMERYVAATWESGAVPVIVLNKADLCPAVPERLAEVMGRLPGVAAHALSARTRSGIPELDPYLAPGRTVVLLGSSGVGKSTLANALLGDDRQSTAAVRASDQRGRHTTTARELFSLPGGALLIDTPGLRGLELWAGEESLDESFADIDELAAGCRFGDCGHASEPGCAVRASIESGGLSADRFANWRKLQRELRAFAARHDLRAQLEQKKRWKTIHKAQRKRPDKRQVRF